MIESLNNFKIKNFFINFTMPTLISAINKDFKLSKTDLEFVRERFNNKKFRWFRKSIKTVKNYFRCPN